MLLAYLFNLRPHVVFWLNTPAVDNSPRLSSLKECSSLYCDPLDFTPRPPSCILLVVHPRGLSRPFFSITGVRHKRISWRLPWSINTSISVAFFSTVLQCSLLLTDCCLYHLWSMPHYTNHGVPRSCLPCLSHSSRPLHRLPSTCNDFVRVSNLCTNPAFYSPYVLFSTFLFVFPSNFTTFSSHILDFVHFINNSAPFWRKYYFAIWVENKTPTHYRHLFYLFLRNQCCLLLLFGCRWYAELAFP